MAEVADREMLLEALSIIDSLDAGWQPGDLELGEARYVDNWTIFPQEEGLPFRLIGLAWSLPIQINMISAPMIAVDRAWRWARIWDEWVAIGQPHASKPAISPDDVRRASVTWLSAALRRRPLHA